MGGMLLPLEKEKESGDKTGGKNDQRLLLRFGPNRQKWSNLSMNSLLKTLEKLIYSGSMEEVKRVQLSPISTM
jgi:hypothetical protein